VNENALGKKICLMASELGHRIFRSNVGEGWIGQATFFSKPAKIEVYPGDVIIRKAKRIHFGLCNGQGDYIGFSKTGKFISIELKTETGKIREEQILFSDAVNRAGGIAGIVMSEEEAFDLLS
jgi:hypothetical protein